jgi:hypothetical protein
MSTRVAVAVAVIAVAASLALAGGAGYWIGFQQGISSTERKAKNGSSLEEMKKMKLTGQKVGCINQLKMLERAKITWALERKQTAADVPTWSALIGPDREFQSMPECLSGGTYTLGAVGEPPKCSVPGHELPVKAAY